MPYAQILAAPKSDTTPATIAAWNDSSKTITALQGSTAEQLVQKTFPKAKLDVVPGPERGVPEVATGRANGHRGRELPARAVQQVEPQQAQGGGVHEAAARRVRLVGRAEGQRRAVKYLNKFICKVQKHGQLAKIYKQTEGATLPPMPAC